MIIFWTKKEYQKHLMELDKICILTFVSFIKKKCAKENLDAIMISDLEEIANDLVKHLKVYLK